MPLPRIIALACLLPTIAGAEVTLIMDENGAGDTTISVRDDRVSMSSGDESSMTTLFRADNDTLYMIDHNSKTYTELDREAMRRMGSAMGDAMKQMVARLESMPAEQREAMMAHLPPQARAMMDDSESKKPALEISKTGKTAEFGGYECEYYQVKQAGEANSRACMASPKTLGISKADFKTIASMFDLMTEMADAMPGGDEARMPPLGELGVMPIRTESTADGEISTLKSVSNSALPDALYKVPADYKRQELPGG